MVQPRAGLDAVAVIFNIPWKDATWGEAILNPSSCCPSLSNAIPPFPSSRQLFFSRESC